MKSPRGILWKGVLEPLMHVCTDLKISKESNVLIQVIQGVPKVRSPTFNCKSVV